MNYSISLLDISADLMADRVSGDIAPDQVDQIDNAIEIIARVLANVWSDNPAKEGGK